MPAIEISEIQAKLAAGFKLTQQANGKDLVLVIGNTGVGKSTFLNYMLGHTMRENEELDVIEAVETSALHIGHEMRSETLYARPVVSQDYPWVFTDCPGFLDNRITNDTIVTSISMELAIRSANQVKGIIILMDATEFLNSRLSTLSPLMKILIKLFRDPVEMLKYSVIGVTKTDKMKGGKTKSKRMMVQAFGKIKEECQRKIQTLQSEFERQGHKAFFSIGSENKEESDLRELTVSDYKVMTEYISAVLRRQDEIVFIDVLDDGDSKQHIIDRIHAIRPRTEAQTGHSLQDTLPTALSASAEYLQLDTLSLRPITVADFNFEHYDVNRRHFNLAIYDFASEGSRLIGAIIGVANQLKRMIDMWQDNKIRMAALNKLKSELQNYISVSEGPRKLLNTWSEMLSENAQSIQSAQEDIHSIKNQIKKHEQELNEVNTDKPIKFAEKIYLKKEWYWTHHKELFKFDTENESVPIVDVDKHIGNGCWCYTKDERKKGRYKSLYLSDWLAYGDARITVYIASKDEEGNRKLVRDLQTEIHRSGELLAEIQANLSLLEESKDRLLSSIKSMENVVQEEVEKDRADKMLQCDGEIEQLSARMTENRKQIKMTKAKALKLLKKFCDDSESLNIHKKFKIVKSINELLQLPGTLVDKFIERYEGFKAEFKTIQKCFRIDLDKEDLSQFSQDNSTDQLDRAINRKDPISGKWIRTLVVTKAGTGFELSSLVEQFPENCIGSVFEFIHPTGKKERIFYGDWTIMSEWPALTGQEERFSQADQVLGMSSNDPLELIKVKKSVEEEIELLVQGIQEQEEELFAKRDQLKKITERLKGLGFLLSVDETEETSSIDSSFIQIDAIDTSFIPDVSA
ncbi:uncharacterized protein TRIADDRAFT_57168 [Trichoplax adhaerens]|uniref:G domain-containing protein n=1 Tax=Trichoplax adhaerens TaxID=10228 RepID=B3S0U0_TRIAD|nr:predicted protein [Trichoplax adhaerens]EDV23704.1 predicted protein [Trichoplax adhaerens]|eukprot:XP_002113230.1 predicted protein [Trichoplax adhaerens]